jgi:hypothetical protein
MKNLLTQEIMQHLLLLEKRQQEKVLEFIKGLSHPMPKNTEILKMAGTIDSDSLKEMELTIEAGCNRVEDYE